MENDKGYRNKSYIGKHNGEKIESMGDIVRGTSMR